MNYAVLRIETQKFEIDHFSDTPVVQKGIYNLNEYLKFDKSFVTFIDTIEFENIKYNDQKSLFDFLTKRKTE